MRIRLLCLLLLIPVSKTSAEPWLSNRYAQNCAACHAPSRMNLEPSKRRCTLSCQGCHVNPNGGGLRNFYGKWTSERWLKSFHSTRLKNKEKPLPWFAQGYMNEAMAQKIRKAFLSKNPKIEPKVLPKDAKRRRVLAKVIKITKKLRNKKSRKHHTTSDFKINFNESYYERDNGDDNWTRTAKNTSEFETTIPKEDPYFVKKEQNLNVGLDLRYMGTNDSVRKKTSVWPMALDVGLQFKPLPDDSIFGKLSFVSETRYLNGPTNGDPEFIVTGSVISKSAYIMIDDLPYNVYIMHGLYRPMFEHYTPDHRSLAQTIMFSGTAHSALYKTTSIGAAPNVPFLNIHRIEAARSPNYSQDEGIVVNLGGRWVTRSLSLVGSMWSTKNKVTNLKINAASIHGGARFDRYIVNAQALVVDRESTTSRDKGNIWTLENRYQLIKESYLEFVYELSNTTAALQEGSADQMYLGYKMYLFPGMEFSAGYRQSNDRPKSGSETKLTATELQAHLYF